MILEGLRGCMETEFSARRGEANLNALPKRKFTENSVGDPHKAFSLPRTFPSGSPTGRSSLDSELQRVGCANEKALFSFPIFSELPTGKNKKTKTKKP